MLKAKVTSLILAAAALIAASLSGPTLAASDPALIEAAKKEGTVTWASGLIFNQAVRPLAQAFEKKYGIKVETTTSGDLLLNLRAPASMPAGLRLYLQSYVFDPTNPQLPVSTSNVLAITVL